MRQLWEDAAASYFDPDRFQLALQNCITVSRTVTFILQANKREVEGFDEWYAQHQESWRADPTMTWAKEARNAIEKKGDLETHSQVRAMIVADYLDGPETEWAPQALFESPHQIYLSVPKRFLIPHVLENGTLVIERRWVDRELPSMEVLEALAYVYGRLADMVVSFLNHAKVPVPPEVTETRPDAMGALAMDRAMYLSMKDGSLRGFRYLSKPLEKPDAKNKSRLVARYGKIAKWKHLKEAKTFRVVAEAYFKSARNMMLRDGFHHSFTFFLKGLVVISIIPTDHADRASRYVLMRDLARLARIEGADGVFMIGEAWTAQREDIPKSGFAVDAKKRGEALLMNAANSRGESFVLEAMIERKRNNPKKVKRIGKTLVIEGGFQFIFYPFMREWGCVDEEKMMQAIEQMDTMGIETLKIDDKNADQQPKR